MIQEINIDPKSPVIKDVAELLRPLGEGRQRVFGGQWHVADEKLRFRAGRAGAAISTHNQQSVYRLQDHTMSPSKIHVLKNAYVAAGASPAAEPGSAFAAVDRPDASA
jgi:hypothetical protein